MPKLRSAFLCKTTPGHLVVLLIMLITQFTLAQQQFEATDSAVFEPLTQKLTLYGKAQFQYNTISMEAGRVAYDGAKRLITASTLDSISPENRPKFKSETEQIEADRILYNIDTKKGKITNAFTKQGGLNLYGGAIKKDSNAVVYFNDMRCLPCEDRNAKTMFRARRAKVIPNDKIVTGPVYLEIAGIPTPLALPFGFFPNSKKRMNGILMPQYGNSPNQGLFFRDLGYYYGINEHHDMIWRGDLYLNGSWGLNTTTNYKYRYRNQGQVFLGTKLFYTGDPDIPALSGKSRSYEIRWTHQQDPQLRPGSNFAANINYVYNQDINRLNTQNNTQFLQNNFLSNVAYTKNFKTNAALSVNAQVNQNTQSKTVNINLPSATFNINRFYPFQCSKNLPEALKQIGISYMLNTRNSLSGNESTIFKGHIADSLNYGAYQHIPITTNFNIGKHITWTPALDFNAWTYGQRIERYVLESLPARISTKRIKGLSSAFDAAFTSVFNTKMYTDYIFFKGPFKHIRHVMMPSLIYNYKPDFTESLGYWKTISYNNIPYSYSVFEQGILGGPGRGTQNTMLLDIQNTIEGKRIITNDTGFSEKKIPLIQNLRLSASYNFAADSFKASNWLVSARTLWFKNLNVVGALELDPYAYTNEGLRTKVFSWQTQQQPKLKTLNLAFNTNLNAALFNSKSKSTFHQWNINIGLNINGNNTLNTFQVRHYATVSADIQPSKNWKFNILTGYDFYLNQRSYTTVRVYRDLNCWEASLFWVPFGINQSYNFAINLKSSMFSELKINRQRSWYDAF